MRSVFTKAVLLATVMTGAMGLSSAVAQDALNADVPFTFIVSGKTHDAGKYEFRVADDAWTVNLQGPGNAAGILPVITRLAAPDTPVSDDGRIVFDKVGDTYYLSEIWIPGQDGFLIYAAKEPHTHHALRLHRATKVR